MLRICISLCLVNRTLPRPTATIQPGHIVHFAHPSISPVKQMDWACQFHLRDELHKQHIVLKCNNHNPAGLLGADVNYYLEALYLRGPHAQGHFMIDIKPGSHSYFQAFK
jgi:hypothetical protein